MRERHNNVEHAPRHEQHNEDERERLDVRTRHASGHELHLDMRAGKMISKLGSEARKNIIFRVIKRQKIAR